MPATYRDFDFFFKKVSARGFSPFAAYRGTSLRSWFQAKTASQRRFAAYRGTSLRLWFQKKCLLSIEIWFFFFKKMPATYGDFDFFFKKVPATYGDFDFFSPKYPQF